MQILDGSHTDYNHTELDPNIHMWGWLGDSVPQIGWPDKQIKKNVVTILEGLEAVDRYRGFHVCEICGAGTFNGSIKMQMPGDDTIYCCPAGVEHYITEHDYFPGLEIVDVVINGHLLTEKDLYSGRGDDFGDAIRGLARPAIRGLARPAIRGLVITEEDLVPGRWEKVMKKVKQKTKRKKILGIF